MMRIGSNFICEGCETNHGEFYVTIPSFYSFVVKCGNCKWDEPVDSIDELIWYLSESLVIDEESLPLTGWSINGDVCIN